MKTTEAVTQLVDLLTPFDSEERKRIVSAVLMLLGEHSAPALGSKANQDQSNAEHAVDIGVHQKANHWAKQNGLTLEDLQQVFHIQNTESAAEVIGALPGSSEKQKVAAAYLLAGAANFIGTGNPSFSDKPARELCQKHGCYGTNHSKYLDAAQGNYFSGSKEKGWTLTHPGLKQAAILIKEVAKSAS